jgi:hypothetical protein
MTPPDLGHKIGPLPLWAWGGAIGAGVFIAYRRHAASPAAAAATTSDGQTMPATAGNLATGSSDGTVGDVGDVGSSTGTAITDNASWEQAAIRALIAQGFDPYAAQTACESYLEGLSLSAAQQAMVSTALLAVGPTPTPPTPPATDGTGATVPTNGGTDGVITVDTTPAGAAPVVGQATAGLDQGDPVTFTGNVTHDDGSVWYEVHYQTGPPYQVMISGPTVAAAAAAAPVATAAPAVPAPDATAPGGSITTSQWTAIKRPFRGL